MSNRRRRIADPSKPSAGQLGSVGVGVVSLLVLLYLCIAHGLL
ncbi:hypothetical protein [Rhodococcus sp. BP-241]|nr:hypothetical protein [Rhodococcus sp. BP-241]